MKEASEVFKSIRYAKVAPRGKQHKSTDDEEHGTVGEKEYEDQVKHVKKMAGMAEEVEQLDEKNAPTNPALWSRAKALARSKFDVYPSAYANGWASKWYKSKGGGWKSVSEEVVEETEKKPYPKTWHDVDPKLGKAVDKMSQAEKVKKGFAHPDTLKKKKQQGVAEEVEQLDEMPGANMDTRAVHSHLKKKGWSLTRTSGSHDVYTHPEAKHHIAVPRHKQLKAPLVKGILKQSEVREDYQAIEESTLSRIKELVKEKARQRAGIKEQMEPEDSPEKTDTPAKRSLSKTAGMVKDLANKAKQSKKEKPDTFQPEPELSSQIVKP